MSGGDLALALVAEAPAPEGLSQLVKDWFELISKSVAILGGIVLATKAMMDFASSIEQRKLELRWKQASTAREILKEIHADPCSMAAIEMLDWGEGRHSYTPNERGDLEISEADVERALATERTRATERKDEYVWRCFDWLFYRIDRLQHHVNTKLLVEADIDDVFRPYVARINAHRDRYRRVIESQGYRNVAEFLDRVSKPAEPKRAA